MKDVASKPKRGSAGWISLTIGRICCMGLGAFFLGKGMAEYGFFHFFDYFTYVSNVIVLVTMGLLVLGLCGRRFFLYTTSYITVTILVYATLLSPGLFKEDLQSWALHYIIPIYTIVDFFFLSKPKKLSYKGIWSSLIIPLCYGGYVLLYGIIEGEYPYFFVDVNDIGYGGFIRNVLLLVVGFLVPVLGYTFLNNIRTRRYEKRRLKRKYS